MGQLDKAGLRQSIAQNEVAAICIDTNVFEAQSFAFHRGILSQLIGLRESGISLLVPDVIESEIVRHMAAKAQEAIGPLRKSLRVADALGLIGQSADQILERVDDFDLFAKGRMDAFVDSVNGKRIKVSDFANLEDVIQRFASESAPFEARKKSEFPDAFALSALAGWAERSLTTVVVISDDKGWHEYCDTSGRVHSAPSLADVIGALQVAQPMLLQRAIANLSSIGFVDFERMLSDRVISADIDVQAHSYHHFDYEVAEVSLSANVSDLSSSACELIGADFEQFVMRVDVEVDLGLVVNFTFEVYDSVDRDYISMGSTELLHDESVVIACLVHFEYDNVENGELSVVEVELIEPRISVDVGEVEMDLGGPDEY
ncbi:PIN domain-containing protein [Stenotrophomonas sp.]|uniref:PIN domain-containing protein n=1 Tax=Stenotrophomonas sp. TaxID=69392 RepID=UPI0028AE9FB4|nr:PIN domain-containing protein [Stenotrophomonas sp.]